MIRRLDVYFVTILVLVKSLQVSLTLHGLSNIHYSMYCLHDDETALDVYFCGGQNLDFGQMMVSIQSLCDCKLDVYFVTILVLIKGL